MARVLVIDDDTFVRKTLAHVLRSMGHEPAEAENGRKGVEMQRQQGFHVVITDMVMPVQGGLETIRILKREFGWLPIIAMSGGAHSLREARLVDASDAGALATLTKPFTPDELLSAMAKCQECAG